MAEDTRDNLSLTDDEENDYDEYGPMPELHGTLSKWTNYIHGWQDRYIVLKEGTLSYYKSETETAFGCRGAVSLAKAVISPHEFDECRFDVNVNDCVWYLRTQTPENRQQWVDSLEIHKHSESGYGSTNSLRRQGSVLSLTSATSLSTTSASSFKRGRGLREKLLEMETFRDILCRQVDTLQSYFDACASAVANHSIHDMVSDDLDDIDDLDLTNGHNVKHSGTFPVQEDSQREKDIVNILQQHGAHAIDFKGEAFTFKATTAGILATLSHCIELMSQREDAWRKRLEREVEKRKKVEDAFRTLRQSQPKPIIVGGPDFEEGPHSMINEDEFFDAVESTLDKLEKEEERRLRTISSSCPPELKPPLTSLDPDNRLYEEVNRIVADHIRHADMTAADVADTWALIAEEGDMKVYKRELEEDGMIVDPLKAVHTVKGITGHELCHYFWDPAVRMEWEGTLDASSVVEWVSQDTVITHQVHKRVWPASQRDSLFWSTIRHCPSEDDEGPDYWIVVNYSTDHPDAPVGNKCVRIRFNIALICQTVVQPPESGQEISRENLTCKIQYSANVNPGGWAPPSVLRAVYKREYPRFLKRFTNYVIETTKDKPLYW
jgi:collagen type IV alpha-3-binding protein